MARPTKYDEARAKKITDLLRTGCTRKASYQSAGISQDTFLTWLRRFPDFLDSVTRAEADAENLMVAIIRKAAVQEGDWRAAESWLKRRRPSDWGDRAQIDVRNLTDEQLIALLATEDAGAAGAGGV